MGIKSKKLKSINVKSSVVDTKSGAFLRKSYVKQAEVNVDEPSSKKHTTSISDKEIDSHKPLNAEDGGISNGVEFVNFKDGSTGYFKPVKGEPFVRKISSP